MADPLPPDESDPFRTVPPAAGPDARRLARLAALTALAIVGRVAFVWAPNFALTYFVVFLAGLLDGRRAGATVGFLAMTVTNLLYSGLHPVLLANGAAMALLGILGGSLRRWLVDPPRDRLDHALRTSLLFACGLFGTFLFSVCSDLLTFTTGFLLAPEGAGIGLAALPPLLLMGLVFNLLPAAANALLFASLTPVLLHALRRAGHLAPRRGAPTAARSSPAPAPEALNLGPP